ncbi:uncharacterized protein Z518_05107 [Rhinocladiella mackenziei CBS 650.93]|uniref:Zn(2)-C6 fungal-type domain-containing protein n=1 Tax=Rhinocladiella mackenziei CBS 650.93 TaxID=1442369 RepID=A0A0D2JD92_9EURO|nr:uncharacterized protein Z518_05107 [Rhinocladiella mackenziei CBS 650.93]KIX07130.1 hypothetical protein Z518_05107 [Rhinocladiella mackenziei CBS 650.93]
MDWHEDPSLSDPSDWEFHEFLNLDAMANHPDSVSTESPGYDLDQTTLNEGLGSISSLPQNFHSSETNAVVGVDNIDLVLQEELTGTTPSQERHCSLNQQPLRQDTIMQCHVSVTSLHQHTSPQLSSSIAEHQDALPTLESEFNHNGRPDSLYDTTNPFSQVSANTSGSMHVQESPEPDYIPMVQFIDGSNRRQTPLEGCGILNVGYHSYDTCHRKRKRNVTDQQNRDQVIEQGGACLRCKWKKSRCSPGPVCHMCAKEAKRAQRSTLFWTECIRADVLSFNVFIPGGLIPATLMSIAEAKNLRRGSFRARFAHFLGDIITPQTPGYSPLRLLQLNFLADLSVFNLHEADTHLSRFRAIAVFARANHLLSASQMAEDPNQSVCGRSTFLSPREYLGALAPGAESYVEHYRAHASVEMLELLEDFVRSHSSVSQSLRMPCTGLMIVVASVLYCGLVESVLPSCRDQQTESQQFLGKYLLHSIKIFCTYAFPSAEGLVEELGSVELGDSLPEKFIHNLNAHLNSAPVEPSIDRTEHLRYLNWPRPVSRKDQRLESLGLEHAGDAQTRSAENVHWIYSGIPPAYTQIFDFTVAELSGMMNAFHFRPSSPTERISASTKNCQPESFKTFRLFLRASLEAAIEIIAHERELCLVQRASDNHNNSPPKLPVMQFGTTAESDWACSMIALGSMFRTIVLDSFAHAELVQSATMQHGHPEAAIKLCEAVETQIAAGFKLLCTHLPIWRKWTGFASHFAGRKSMNVRV